MFDPGDDIVEKALYGTRLTLSQEVSWINHQRTLMRKEAFLDMERLSSSTATTIDALSPFAVVWISV